MLADREDQKLREAAEQVKQAIQDRIDLKSVAENVKLEITPEGLRIQLIDQDQKSMFPLGSANMQEGARKLMEEVAKIISPLPNKITISGHTDSTPFKGGVGGYSNWELSADRANASRRVLVANGVSDTRLQLVVGKADKDPLMPNEPAASQNRRISVVVLRDLPPPAAPAPSPAEPGPDPGTAAADGAALKPRSCGSRRLSSSIARFRLRARISRAVSSSAWWYRSRRRRREPSIA